MRINPKSEAEARQASRNNLITRGWHDGRITEATEKLSNAGNDMIELSVTVVAQGGSEITVPDWLTASDRTAQKLRNACIAVDALAAYEAGEITAVNFPGHTVRVKIGVQKRHGYSPRNTIEDYALPAGGAVVNLRRAG